MRERERERERAKNMPKTAFDIKAGLFIKLYL